MEIKKTYTCLPYLTNFLATENSHYVVENAESNVYNLNFQQITGQTGNNTVY